MLLLFCSNRSYKSDGVMHTVFKTSTATKYLEKLWQNNDTEMFMLEEDKLLLKRS